MALTATSQLDLVNTLEAPAFTAVSLYKIVKFRDLGALVVRKKSSHVLRQRRCFGGGTVNMVINGDEDSTAWCTRKETLHQGHPHSTALLLWAWPLMVHDRVYGSMDNISRYTCVLAGFMYDGIKALRHANSIPRCRIYSDSGPVFGDRRRQGPIIAFNIMNSLGDWVGNPDVE